MNAPKSIALGVCGGIAAYKSAELVRLLVKAGHRVIPMMTPAGAQFLGPLTLEALCGQRVRMSVSGKVDPSDIEHISIMRDIDLMVLAPLTANTAAKLAHGVADHFLTTAYLAYTGPVLACPAMNTKMLLHKATQRNLQQLEHDGAHLLHGEPGELACGDEGMGRMAEPDRIAQKIEQMLSAPPLPAGTKVLVSAGPTCEDIDPVRYITNRSSGKMGLAVAKACLQRGAQVTLVHGPIQLPIPTQMNAIACRSADDMAQAIIPVQDQFDVIIMTAAVADFTPNSKDHKLKKASFDGTLKLSRTTDILRKLGQQKPVGQRLVGFAAETDDLEQSAQAKLAKKNLDWIFANSVGGTELGFASDRNQLVGWHASGARFDLGVGAKTDLARTLVELVFSDHEEISPSSSPPKSDPN